MASSSSAQRKWAYDVFLSFRGPDTRQGFTDHLYVYLVNAGLRVFRDDAELQAGRVIPPSLFRAIEESKILLVVLSQNYASSSWCLRELVRIMECRVEHEEMVIPIFYHVDPSDVRHQKGSYGMAFKKHETRETQDEISGWRSALRDVANLSGWDSSAYGSEAQFSDEIVDGISRMLSNTYYLHVAVYPVGIESRIQGICDSLCDGKEDDVRMVGIWGMGGSGKTSLAKAVYNKFSPTFKNKSFLGNVRETAKESNGKITLQERLLYDILKSTKIKVGDADRGIVVIKERLGSKKVLVIVDDVDDMDQLTALAISRDSFGPGSRIIITTRYQHVLDLLNVEKIHQTQKMKDEEALELFSWHAFQNPCIESRFLELTRRVLDYCGGLPLALEVLGSFLYKQSISYWESTLKKLEKFPNDKIQKILKISYDALDENQRDIFLHISCFFIGMDKKYVTQILDGCGLEPEGDVRVLLQRCLVTVSEKNKLMMHDLLRDMGREVVRVESPKEPENRTRLWHQKEVMRVLSEESGTNKIEGLALNLQRSNKKSFRTMAFQNMKRLRLLQLNYVQLDGDYDCFSKQLRWLCWHGFSRRTIQNDFLNEQNLVSIDLQHSNLVQVWEQSRLLKKLKILNFSHSHYLTQTPDFSNLPNLKYLILKDCQSLSEIHESIGHHRKLALLNLKDCILLKVLPKSFYKLKSVETLILSGCSSFENLSDDIEHMTSLTTLLVNGSAISQVPSCLERLKLNYSSQKDLFLVKQRYPDVPRSHFPVPPQGFTSVDVGNSSFHIPPEGPSLNNFIPASGDALTMSEGLESDHSAALAIVPSSPKPSRKSILQGPTANGEGDVLPHYYISPSFLSNMKCKFFNYCASLLITDLATNLKELKADHCTNALGAVWNFSETLRQNILQGSTAMEDGGIFLAGNDFPKRFTYVRKSNHVFFQVPQIIGCNLKALTVRVVCSLHFGDDRSPKRSSIVVTNHTKFISSVVRPAHPTEITSLHEVVWQGNLSNNQLRLENGDFLEVEVVTEAGLRVKKTGVSLVWDPNLIIDNMIECEPIPYENFQTDAYNQAGPSMARPHEDRPFKRPKFIRLVAVLLLLALFSYLSQLCFLRFQ